MTSTREYIHPYTNNRIIKEYPHGGLTLEKVKALRAAGKKVCKWCGGRPKGARRFWCSDECVFQWYMRANPSYARRRVFMRDGGVCALCAAEGNHEPHDVWQADHIVPVSEGGGECGLENYRTICTDHHHEVTAESRRRKKSAKLVASGQLLMFPELVPDTLVRPEPSADSAIMPKN